MIKKQISCLVCVCLLLSLIGCQWIKPDDPNQDTTTVYFYNDQTNQLEGERVTITLQENAQSVDRMNGIIEALYNGPQSKGQVNKYLDFQIQTATLKENRAYIHFEKTYLDLDVQSQMAYRAAIVWSLTELDYIEEVEFFIEDEPIRTSSGARVGGIGRQDIVINVLIPTPQTSTQIISLYFVKEGSDKIHKEQREIHVNNSIPLERYIIEELIKGPVNQDLLPVLPADTKLNDIRTQEGICQVDLSYTFNTAQGGLPVQEAQVIYAIVDALTERTTIQKVLFLKDGKKQIEFETGDTTTGIFERNEEIIETTP